jgi:predicted amidohydrolase
MRAAAIQLNSNQDKGRNLGRAERLLRAAAADGAGLAVLPEKFNVLGAPDDLRAGAEPVPGPTTDWAAALCRELDLWLVAGSIVERVEGDEKLRNTSVLVGPDGELHATYRKIHLFDVEVGGTVYRESDAEAPGDTVVVADAGGLPLGMAICYDLRFPELFRITAVRGARAIALPVAFTVPTGRAHWEVLVRARAIENQVFMIAAGQVGRHPPDHESYGHSLIVDPWGVVLAEAPDAEAPDAEAPDGECFIAADLDLEGQDEVRERLPSLAHRRPEAYRWPQPAGAAP